MIKIGPGNPLMRALANIYGVPPLSAFGRFVATNYQLVRGEGLLAVKRRSESVCQIMIFHKVNDDGDAFLPATPVAVFRQQMQHLATHFRTVSLDEVSSGSAYDQSSFSVAVTFDDGYRDNFLFALPILRQFNIPATIYLAAGYIDTGESPWYDQVCLAFRDTTAASVSFSQLGGPDGRIEQTDSRLNMLARVILWLRGMDESDRAQAMGAIFDQLRTPTPRTLGSMLSWDEIRSMRRQGITFGAHTMWHPALSRISDVRAEQEIMQSKERVQAETQHPVDHFAYPFGRRADIGSRAEIVQAAGFKTAVTTEWGFNTIQQDPFQLRRCAPWETEKSMFAMKFDWNRFTARTTSDSIDAELVS